MRPMSALQICQLEKKKKRTRARRRGGLQTLVRYGPVQKSAKETKTGGTEGRKYRATSLHLKRKKDVALPKGNNNRHTA